MSKVRITSKIGYLIFMIILSYPIIALTAEQEDWEEARQASCSELSEAYKTTANAESKIVAALKESKDGTIATNVLGVASFAIVGIGFFTWDNNESAEENLADLREDLKIISTVASEKKCSLPELSSSKK